MNISTTPHQIFVRPAVHTRPIQVVSPPKSIPANPVSPTWHSISPGDPYDVKKYNIQI